MSAEEDDRKEGDEDQEEEDHQEDQEESIKEKDDDSNTAESDTGVTTETVYSLPPITGRVQAIKYILGGPER